MNFRRKSTIGWSVGNILLDLTGGVLNFCQMGVQSIDQRKLHLSFDFTSWFVLHYYCFPHWTNCVADTLVNFYGNIGKTLLSLVSTASNANNILLIFYNTLLSVQKLLMLLAEN